MKRFGDLMIRFSLFLIVFFAFTSCNKQDEILEQNIQEIEQYIADNNLTNVQKTESGLHYIVTQDGNGNFPNTSSTVTVKYKGFLKDNSVFDQNPNAEFLLSNVIEGWQEGIPKFSKGGKGILLIPSKLGYGTKGAGSIPSNAILIFEVDLLDFN